MTELAPPPGYEEAIADMANAARAWIQAHPYACLVLNSPNAAKMGVDPANVEIVQAMIDTLGDGLCIATGLDDALTWWPGNQDTRDLLWVMWRASDNRATYTQACRVLDQVFAGVGQA